MKAKEEIMKELEICNLEIQKALEPTISKQIDISKRGLLNPIDYAAFFESQNKLITLSYYKLRKQTLEWILEP